MGKNIFNSIKISKPKKHKFDLSHDVKLSCNPGQLIPTCCIEAVPGDSFNISCQSLLRFAPLISPVMHSANVFMHYFFVPNRILWPNWQKWITGDDSVTAPYLTVAANGANYGKLLDYMGIPNPGLLPATNDENISALPFAAYQMIYKEWYRDENLITSPYEDTDGILTDGDNTIQGNNLIGLQFRAWEKDYFTAALPFAQKGSPVSIPLGEVELDPSIFTPGRFVSAASHGSETGAVANTASNVTANSVSAVYDPQGTLITGSTSINDLRQAIKLQEWLEKNARGGTRYTENILMHFGVRSSDQRMQRPEYITGTRSPIVISEVLNTTGTDALPQGNMAGHGISLTSGQYGKYFCEEHGFIIGIMSILPRTAYSQGIAKMYQKYVDPLQYYWPSFAHLGEQTVFNSEIFAFQATVDQQETFGYVPRYAEYKYQPSRIAGDFRSTLNFWTWARNFTGAPALNQQFVEATFDTNSGDINGDIFAVTDADDDHLYCQIYHQITAIRPMPIFGTPHL